MNFVLTNAVLWPLAILVVAPLILHLFARSKPPHYAFSSIEFILRVIRKTIRIKRPQDWILLLIRTLLFAAVVLLFLQPLYFSKRRLSGPFERKNVVLVVDATASMAYTEGAQTRFASACAHASEILSGLSARDTANIVWLRAKPDSVFPDMGVNFGYLQSVLRQARVTSEAGNPGEAIRLAVRLLENAEGRREICVLSDFQKTAWETADAAVPPAVDLVKVKIGKETGVNGALSEIHTDPPKPLANEDVVIHCDVYNYSPQPRRRTVFLRVQESRQSQDIMIPAWSRGTASFRHRFTAPGTFPVAAVLSEDSFAGDDSRWALVDVRGFLHVGIVPAEPLTARAWQRALDALGWARTETISTNDLAAGPLSFDAILLSGTPPPGSNIMERVKEGCTVVWSPGTHPFDARWATGVRWEQPPEGRKLKLVAEKDEVFRLFADGEHGDPARGVVHGRLVVRLPAGESAEVLLAYDDGVPALARYRQGGQLFLWNLPLQPEFSDYAAHPEYLPLFAEMLLSARTLAANRRDSTDFLPGERLAWRFDSDVLASDVKLTRLDGSALPVQERRTSRDVTFVSADLPEPGAYLWEHQGRMLGYNTMNFPAIESDLRTLSLNRIETKGAIGVTEGRTVRLLRDGIKLWPALLALAIVLALLEGVALLWVEQS